MASVLYADLMSFSPAAGCRPRVMNGWDPEPMERELSLNPAATRSRCRRWEMSDVCPWCLCWVSRHRRQVARPAVGSSEVEASVELQRRPAARHRLQAKSHGCLPYPLSATEPRPCSCDLLSGARALLERTLLPGSLAPSQSSGTLLGFGLGSGSAPENAKRSCIRGADAATDGES